MSKQIHIGSTVSVIDENLQGQVISISGDSVLFVDADGFQWSYASHELVVYNELTFSDEKIQEKEKSTSIAKKNKQLIKLGDVVSVLDEEIKGQVIEINKKQITIKESNGFKSDHHIDSLIVYDALLLKDNTRVPKASELDKTKKTPKIIKSSIVDLHNTNHYLAKNKILENQLKIFKDELNFAVNNKQTEIIFIHGKGEGILKKEIENILKKEKIQYKKAPHRLFGQGALQVSLVDVNWIVR